MRMLHAMDALGGTPDWTDANKARLLAGLHEVRVLLEAHVADRTRAATIGHMPTAAAGRGAASAGQTPAGHVAFAERLQLARAAERQAVGAMRAPAALDTVAAGFGLSAFERRILLLCAGVELDGGMAELCITAQGDAHRAWPTFGLALAAFQDPHWSALTPSAPLRHWQLVDVLPGDTLTGSPLRIDERVLHHLTGISLLDVRLQPLLRRIATGAGLAASQEALARRITAAWADGTVEHPAILLCGPDPGAARQVAASACALVDAPVFALRARDVPAAAPEREQLARLWDREVVLSGSVLFLDGHDADDAALRAAATFVADIRGPVIAAAREALRIADRLCIRLDVPPPAPAEQAHVWREALGPAAAGLNGAVDAVVEHFHLRSDAVRAASVQTLTSLRTAEGDPADALWQACRAQARPRLDDLAQRLEAGAVWDDLVLPPAQKEILQQIAASVAQRTVVYDRWGFALRGRRGLGITALFAGASGTGKTMAADVLGNELRLDVYRIDLSQVVSKYIGETEKNLSRVFDAAEEGGAVLLFDEADALFGKRSEVKDSHDRYANIEVSYLLQRMEAYRGLAILTTNMKGALDSAFLRRIRFVVQFPFPDAAQRAEIWRRAFPDDAPTEGLRPERLARLNVAGGNIRNIAVNAAFSAAAAGEPIRMVHLLRAARAEYAKLEKPLTDAEVAGWV